MDELKQLIKLNKPLVLGTDGNDGDAERSIVYMGDSIEAVLQQTEQNLESKMKLQTLAIVVG